MGSTVPRNRTRVDQATSAWPAPPHPLESELGTEPKETPHRAYFGARKPLGNFIREVALKKPGAANSSDPVGSGRAGHLAFLIQRNPELRGTHLHERPGVGHQRRSKLALSRPAVITMLTFGQLQCARCNYFIVHHFVAATNGATDCRLRPGEYGFHIFDLPG